MIGIDVIYRKILKMETKYAEIIALNNYSKDTIKKILYLNNWQTIMPETVIIPIISINDNTCSACYSNEEIIYGHDSCYLCINCWEVQNSVDRISGLKKCPICEIVVIPPITVQDDQLFADYLRTKCYTCSYCGGYNKNTKKGRPAKKCITPLCPSGSNKLCRYNCGFTTHYPAICKAVIKWGLEIDAVSITDIYINTITKSCPRCSIAIMKDSDKSCLKMHCANCEFVFCWKCLSEYSLHSDNFYTCSESIDTSILEIRKETISQFIKNKEEFATNDFLAKYVKTAQNYLKQEYYESFAPMHNTYYKKYEFNKFLNILNVLNHDFDTFKNTLGRLNDLNKLLKMSSYTSETDVIQLIPWIPKNPDSIIYWDADYNHNNPLIANAMENILNNSMLTIYFDIGEIELITEHYYINFKEMTISDINYPPKFMYNITRYLFPPWKCIICTMHNFPKLTRLQACSACYSINLNAKPCNRLVL